MGLPKKDVFNDDEIELGLIWGLKEHEGGKEVVVADMYLNELYGV